MATITRDLAVDWGTTGATLYYRVVDEDDSALVARTTTGVTEFPAGSGIYHVKNTAWDTDWTTGRVIWDDGSTYAVESILIGEYLDAAVSSVSGSVISSLAAGSHPVVIYPVQQGSITIVRGDSYLNDEGTALDITIPTGSIWPTDLTSYTIVLRANVSEDNENVAGTGDVTSIEWTGSVVTATGSSRAVRFEPDTTDTEAMLPGLWNAQVIAYQGTGETTKSTLWLPTLRVLEPQEYSGA